MFPLQGHPEVNQNVRSHYTSSKKSSLASQGIRKRIEFKVPDFQVHARMCHSILRELFVKHANTRTLRSDTKNLLQIPLTNLKRFGDRAFCAYAPRLWNELPDNIKAADSVQNLKKQLKTLLFQMQFISI